MIQKNADSVIFLALVVWREARGESQLAKTGVAMSIINRVVKPCWWGNTIMKVIFKKWQYSSMTDPNDRQLTSWPEQDDVWTQCIKIADDALNGLLEHPAPGADSYYDDSIKPPKWATKENFVKKIGRLNFHNLDMDTEKNINYPII